MELVIPPQKFSWAKLIKEMNLCGMSLLFADNAEVLFYDPTVPCLELQLNEAIQVLYEIDSGQELKEKLTEKFGNSIELKISFGEAYYSPASQRENKILSSHVVALENIENDIFFNEFEKAFGAKVIIESIRYVSNPKLI